MSAVEEFPSQEPSQENVGKSDADGERKAEADVSPSEPQTGVDKEPTGQFAKFQFLTTEQGSAQVPSQVPAAGQQLPKINQDFGVAQTPAATEPTAGMGPPVEAEKPAEAEKAPDSEQRAAAEKPAAAAEVSSSSKTSSSDDEPTITAKVNIPAVSDQESEDGGEWAVLVEKARAWFNDTDLVALSEKLKKPALLIAGILLLLVTLKVYTGILDTIAKVPLAPGLLELAGILWLVWFSTTRLIRSQERQKVITGIQNTWKSFRGKVDS